MPQLALLRFVVYDEQNKSIGHNVLPLVDIQSGYKFISMKNQSFGPLTMCMVFVDICVKNYVQEEFIGICGRGCI